jgi:hypothetical protein
MSRLHLGLYAFFLEHKRCGELGAGVDDEHVWMTCDSSGAVLGRRMEHLPLDLSASRFR